jgi:hypothetical protein
VVSCGLSAVKYEDLLFNFSRLTNLCIQHVYSSDVSKVLTADYLGPEPKTPPQLTGIQKVEVGGGVTCTLGESLRPLVVVGDSLFKLKPSLFARSTSNQSQAIISSNAPYAISKHTAAFYTPCLKWSTLLARARGYWKSWKQGG